MNTPRILILACAAVTTASAQLTLNEIGGSIEAGNYGTLPTTSAFGLNEIGGGGLPIHKIPNIRDGAFGNPNSWIGDSLNSFVGLNFGATPLPVGRVAWGRDNTGTFFDRTAGLYSLDFTLVPSPGSALPFTGDPNTGWANIGSSAYHFGGAPASPLSMSSRHEWSFSQVMATGIRLTAPGSSFADGACIDELEAYSFQAAALTLSGTGGTMRPGNIALSSVPFGKDEILGGSLPIHKIPNIRDGIYGNGNSWIGDSESSFVGLDFGGSFSIDSFAFGRDNTGNFGDRTRGSYLLQYTTAASPGAGTPDNLWTTIGPVYYQADGPDAIRHEYSFAAVDATGIRLIVSGNGIGSGAGIDELEVYQAVPEPGSAALLLGGLVSLAGHRRRRR